MAAEEDMAVELTGVMGQEADGDEAAPERSRGRMMMLGTNTSSSAGAGSQCFITSTEEFNLAVSELSGNHSSPVVLRLVVTWDRP